MSILGHRPDTKESGEFLDLDDTLSHIREG